MDSDKKKVLFVISTLSTGGAQRALANMSMGFPQDWECDFLLNDSVDITYPYKGNIIDLGMKPRKDKTALSYQLQVFIKRFLKLYKLKKEGEYAACISAITSANVVNVLTGNKYCKTIISIRTFMSKAVSDTSNIKNRIKAWTMKLLPNYADYVVSVSKSMNLDMIQNFGVQKEKAVTIYNGYNLNNIEILSREKLNAKEKEWFPEGHRSIVTVGRLGQEKGQAHLIRAFKKVKEKIENVDLLILGEGNLREELQKLIFDLNLENCVTLCGFASNPYKILKNCYLFVLSSLFEGFPNTLAESLCLGVPAVSTDCDSGAREILAPNTELTQKVKRGFEKAEYGILCPVCEESVKGVLTDEENDMAEAILYMLQDKEAYSNYRRMCTVRAKQLSMEMIINQWITLIER